MMFDVTVPSALINLPDGYRQSEKQKLLKNGDGLEMPNSVNVG